MASCVIIVFDNPHYAFKLSDLDYTISPHEIKTICDFDDRWVVFNKYLDEETKELSLCRDNEGLVYNDFDQDQVFGLILKMN